MKIHSSSFRLPLFSALCLFALASVIGQAGEQGGVKSVSNRQKPLETKASTPAFADWGNRPNEPFVNGKANFEQVKSELLKNYYNKDLSENDLYRAAVQGMLTYIDPSKSAWHTLYTPTEYKELTSDMEGEISGVGMQTKFDDITGYTSVAGVIPGSPAEKAGLKAGDQILKINGKSARRMELRDLVYQIRGKAGTDVKLTIFHDESIKEFTLRRQQLTVESGTFDMLPEGTGLLKIHNFSASSPQTLKKIVATFKDKGVKSLVVDLRGNEGGLLDSSLEVIRMFIPKGRTIVKMVERGATVKEVKADGEPMITGIPLVLLINGETKSGAEIMAAALKMSAGATVVGTPTFGKWSAQRLEVLPNNYAIKYTTATFLPPSGPDLNGKGLNPDFHVVEGDTAAEKGAKDVQLQAALQLIASKR